MAEGETFLDYINPDSYRVAECLCEPELANTQPGDKFQFERVGYFCTDKDSTSERPVFNRVVTLKDSWAKINK